MLSALADLLGSLADGASSDRVVEQARIVDRRRNNLEEAVRPITIHGHALGLIGREPLPAAQLAASTTANAEASPPFVHAALTGLERQSPRALHALRRQVSSLRRALASTRDATTTYAAVNPRHETS